MIAQKFCLIKKSGLNPAACQFPEGEVGRTGIHHFIQPLINDSAFGCVSCQRGSRCLQWNKTPSSAEKFSSSAGRSGSSSQLPVSNSRRFVCALPLRQLRAASVCASCGGLGMDAEDLKEVQRRPARTRKWSKNWSISLIGWENWQCSAWRRLQGALRALSSA